MKTRNVFFISIVAIFFSGCVVWSFYPLYTEKDLFDNDVLTGKWIDSDSLQWNFEHPETGNPKRIDKKSYTLHLTDYDKRETVYDVNIIQLKGIYFLDFYISDIGGVNKSDSSKDLNYWNLHIIPVHTFAKLSVKANKLQIDWYNGDWIKEQIDAKKLKIKHDFNGETLLLTANTADLQKMVLKYAETEDAFKDGLSVTLTKTE